MRGLVCAERYLGKSKVKFLGSHRTGDVKVQ